MGYRELQLNPRVCQWAIEALGRLLATFGVVQGLNIALSGIDRFRGPSYATALLLPGSPPSWGWILFTCGVISFIGIFGPRKFRFLVGTGFAAQAVWSIFFAIGFIMSILNDPIAGTTGPYAYGFMAVLSMVLAMVYRDSRKTYTGGLGAVHTDNPRQ